MHSAELVRRNKEQRVNHNSPVWFRFLDVHVPKSIIKHSEVQTVMSAAKNLGFLGQVCRLVVIFILT